MMASIQAQHQKVLGDLLPDCQLDKTNAQLIIEGLSLDSRQVKEGFIFVVMQGLQVHGREYISQAVERGARVILRDSMDKGLDKNTQEIVSEKNIPIIFVDDLQQQLSDIAGRFYGSPTCQMPVIACTGTNGKTTCTQLIAQMLSLIGRSCGVIGTMGFGLLKDADPKSNDAVEVNKIKFTSTGMTTADAIQMQEIASQLLSQGAEALAMEVSSHGLVQHRVEALDINTAIFTNLSHDHLDYHKTMEAYGQAKLKLFTMPSIQSVVINSDDLFAEKILNSLPENVSAVTYGMHLKSDHENHFAFTDIYPDKQGMKAVLHSPEGEFSIQTQLIGNFNLCNLLAVIAALWVNGFNLEAVVKHIPFLKPVLGRMELLPTSLKFQVVVDYAHTPDALKQALLALKPFVTGSLWCIFGCGGDRDKEKRPEMARVAEALADKIIVTNDNPRNELSKNIFLDIQEGFSSAHQEIPDRAEAIDFAIRQAGVGDVILVAGKGHEDYQLIGGERLSFSDQKQARLALREKEREVASD